MAAKKTNKTATAENEKELNSAEINDTAAEKAVGNAPTDVNSNADPFNGNEKELDTAEVKEATAETPLEGIPADVTESTGAAAESEDDFERVIYIGVTIESLGLTQNTIYTLNPSTMPLISAAKKAYPIIKRLLIPVEEYTPMHKHTHRAFYNKLAAAVGAPTI